MDRCLVPKGFPFYFAQLADFLANIEYSSCLSPWAELHEAQKEVLIVPNTRMAVIPDIREEKGCTFEK